MKHHQMVSAILDNRTGQLNHHPKGLLDKFHNHRLNNLKALFM